MDIFTIIIIVLVLAVSFWGKQKKQQAAMQNHKKSKVRAHPIQHKESDIGRGNMHMRPQNGLQIKTSKIKKHDVSKYRKVDPTIKTKSQSSCEKEISFKTNSDARRAFIYSEIFLRKYNI